MILETVHNVVSVQSTEQVTARYEQWVNPVNMKHEQRVIVYSVDLYTNKGQTETYTDQRMIDQLV